MALISPYLVLRADNHWPVGTSEMDTSVKAVEKGMAEVTAIQNAA